MIEIARTRSVSKKNFLYWLVISCICLIVLLSINNQSLPDYYSYKTIITGKLPRYQPLLATGNWAWSGMYLSRNILMPTLKSYESVRIFWITLATGSYCFALMLLQQQQCMINPKRWSSWNLVITGLLTLVFINEFYLCRLRSGICLLFVLYQYILLLAGHRASFISSKFSALLLFLIAGILAFTTHTATYISAVSFVVIIYLLYSLGEKVDMKILGLLSLLYWLSIVLLFNSNVSNRGVLILSDLDLRRLLLACIIPLIIFVGSLIKRCRGYERVFKVDLLFCYEISYAALSLVIVILAMTRQFDTSGEAIARFLSLSSFSSLLLVYKYGITNRTLLCVYLCIANGFLFLKDFIL